MQKRQLTCHSPGRTKLSRKTTISSHTTRKWIPFCGYMAPLIYQLSYVGVTAKFGQVSSLWPEYIAPLICQLSCIRVNAKFGQVSNVWPDAIFVHAWKDYRETGIIQVTVRTTDFHPLRHEIHFMNIHFLPIKTFNRSMLFTEKLLFILTLLVYMEPINTSWTSMKSF